MEKPSAGLQRAYWVVRISWWSLIVAGLVSLILDLFVLTVGLWLAAAALLVGWDVTLRRRGYDGGIRYWRE